VEISFGYMGNSNGWWFGWIIFKNVGVNITGEFMIVFVIAMAIVVIIMITGLVLTIAMKSIIESDRKENNKKYEDLKEQNTLINESIFKVLENVKKIVK